MVRNGCVLKGCVGWVQCVCLLRPVCLWYGHAGYLVLVGWVGALCGFSTHLTISKAPVSAALLTNQQRPPFVHHARAVCWCMHTSLDGKGYTSKTSPAAASHTCVLCCTCLPRAACFQVLSLQLMAWLLPCAGWCSGTGVVLRRRLPLCVAHGKFSSGTSRSCAGYFQTSQ
jgi:hypothetical protein